MDNHFTAFEKLILAIDQAGFVPDADKLAAAMNEAGIIVVETKEIAVAGN